LFYTKTRFKAKQVRRHPSEMGAAEISEFLTHLAVKDKISASTQNQAFFALLFLCRDLSKQTENGKSRALSIQSNSRRLSKNRSTSKKRSKNHENSARKTNFRDAYGGYFIHNMLYIY
jgi:hypothetical protein